MTQQTSTAGKIAFLFPGQGSHGYQMARELFVQKGAFYRHAREADDLLRELTGQSAIDALYDPRRRASDVCDRTSLTHPAIFIVEYALSCALMQDGIEPAYVVATSVGAFAALVVAGCMTLEHALTAVSTQAHLLDQYCPAGSMLALPGIGPQRAAELACELGGEIGAINRRSACVLSIPVTRVDAAEAALRRDGVLYQRLPVSVAFHSRWIDAARAPFALSCAPLQITTPRIPVLCCIDGRELADARATLLWNVIREPIRFDDAIDRLVARAPMQFIDVGPAGSLAAALKRTAHADASAGWQAHAVLSPFGGCGARYQQVLSNVPRRPPAADANAAPKPAAPRASRIAQVPTPSRHPMKILLFAGQGAQFKGMGKDLWPAYRALADTASNLLGYSVEDLCLNDPHDQLRLTQFTQPALYVVNAMHYYRWQEAGERADALAGHSLGEYCALLAAGSFDFATGLRLVQKRGQLMGDARGGGMAAVLGMRADALQALLREQGFEQVDVANLNSPTQTVISSDTATLRKVEALLVARNVKCIVLNVSAPFHSRYMRAAQQEFAAFLGGFTLADPHTPVIANATARPYEQGHVAQMLAQQIVSPVQWTDSVRYLMGLGDFTYVEMGADRSRIGGTVLGKLVDEIRRTETPLRTAPDAPAAVHCAAAPRQPEAPQEAARADRPAPGREPEIHAGAALAARSGAAPQTRAQALGSEAFRRRYRLKYAYVAGAMYRGTASAALVVGMGRAGMIGYLGTGGMSIDSVDAALRSIQSQLTHDEPYGLNLLADYDEPAAERAIVDLYLKYGVRCIEAAAFIQMTPALVKFRVTGLRRGADGRVECRHHVLAKVSRLEVAQAFMSAPPPALVKALLDEGAIDAEQAELARLVPMSHDICVEADSGGHTDGANPTIVLPVMQNLRQRMTDQCRYDEPLCMGLAGGIGTPTAAAAAFAMGADFILTGSINQCTVESGAAETVKELLQNAGIHDMAYAPAGDMFELGSRVQVLKKGLLFPMRANRLHSLYNHFDSLEAIPREIRAQLERSFFRRSLDDVWQEAQRHLQEHGRQAEAARLKTNPKARMARVFRWYFGYSTRLAFSNSPEDLVNYQVHCGPALGAFNDWAKSAGLETWKQRHVDAIALTLMEGAAQHLQDRLPRWINS